MPSPVPLPRTTLIAVTGLSPAVLTETLWALATGPASLIPDHIVVITTLTGRLPNRLVIGLPLWNKLRNNAKVIARFPGAASVA